MEYRGEVVLEEKFQVKVIPEYAFADELSAEGELHDIYMTYIVKGYPSNLRDKTTLTIKNNGESIYTKQMYGQGLVSQFGWSSNDPEIEKYTNLVNPTLDIYDEEMGLYIVQNLPIQFK